MAATDSARPRSGGPGLGKYIYKNNVLSQRVSKCSRLIPQSMFGLEEIVVIVGIVGILEAIDAGQSVNRPLASGSKVV